MPAFDYAAYDRAGKLQSGVIAADSERHARRLLKEQKLLPSTLSEVGRQPSTSEAGGRWQWLVGRRKARVNNFDLALLLQQQAILIQSGLPLEDALKMTIEQAETDSQRRMVQSWRSEIVEGRSFSEALKRSPYQIPESIVAGIGVGEESGHLHEVLRRLAEDIENSAENRKTVSRALIYPATLLATSLIVVSIMMVWVVPKITAIFISSKRELPFMTRVVWVLATLCKTTVSTYWPLLCSAFWPLNNGCATLIGAAAGIKYCWLRRGLDAGCTWPISPIGRAASACYCRTVCPRWRR